MPVSATARQAVDQLDFGDTSAGQRHSLADDGTGIEVQYQHPNGEIVRGDSLSWLPSLPDASVDLVFADPPYNINRAEWDNFESQEAYIQWSLVWIAEASRVLKPEGSLYVCGFSEILSDLRHPASKYFASTRWLVWHYRNKANLGSDWGRSHESIIHFRKSRSTRINVDDVRIPYGAHTLRYPSHPQADTSQYGGGRPRAQTWTPNPLGAKPKDVIEVPTLTNGMAERTEHPTQKPEELIRKFVLASSNPGDLILDPFSGSGTTAVVAEQLGRKWKVCDLDETYNDWAIARLETVVRRTPAEWIEFDRRNAERRESIR